MSLTPEQIKNLKVGDTVYIVPVKSSSNDPYESTIGRITRNYIYLECGKKIDTSVGWIKYPSQYDNALVYINEQEYIQRQLIEEVMELINENGLTYQQALLIKDTFKE